MAETHPVSTWNPLDYFSPEELARLDKRFDYALRDAKCLVFWTGLSLGLAQRWADQHELQTLTIAMGSLFSDRNVGGARYGKSSKAWSKYMRGASGRFAEYACRDGRRAIILTKPPPDIYSTRKWSNYRHLEEPILKGALGGSGAVRIDYVHPTIEGATSFQYQIWPLNRSSEWYTFFKTLLPQGPITRDVSDITAKGEVVVWTDLIRGVVVQMKHDELAHKQQANGEEGQKKAELERQNAREKKEARLLKDARRKKAELERRMAQEKKEARRKKAELEQRIAQKKKEARRKKAELERRMAQEKKEARRKKAELEQRIAQKKKEARRKKAELERQKAQAKKEAKGKQAKLEQQKAREKREAKRKRRAGVAES
jgi:hypothetical protein